jgi:hypothetical protein
MSGQPPDAKGTADEIVAYYVDNKDSVMIGAILVGFAAIALVFLPGYLRAVLPAAE